MLFLITLFQVTTLVVAHYTGNEITISQPAGTDIKQTISWNLNVLSVPPCNWLSPCISTSRGSHGVVTIAASCDITTALNDGEIVFSDHSWDKNATIKVRRGNGTSEPDVLEVHSDDTFDNLKQFAFTFIPRHSEPPQCIGNLDVEAAITVHGTMPNVDLRSSILVSDKANRSRSWENSVIFKPQPCVPRSG
ncbi:hypothetical protein SprV_0602148500 [Sparganum proliferum]